MADNIVPTRKTQINFPRNFNTEDTPIGYRTNPLCATLSRKWDKPTLSNSGDILFSLTLAGGFYILLTMNWTLCPKIGQYKAQIPPKSWHENCRYIGKYNLKKGVTK